jgi:predicted dehydrogenase/nucleoside-diphosphate-sugar epimerase
MSTARDFLVLGGGAVVAEFYLPAFQQLGWLERVRVVEPSERARGAMRHGPPRAEIVAGDFRDAIATAAADGVRHAIVALPNALHEAAVDLALDRGLDVLCEKPLAMTAHACRRLADRADHEGRIVAVGMTRRFLPCVQSARDVLQRGWLGELRSIAIDDGHAFAWTSESGGYFRRENGGVLANIGVHALDLVSYLCGDLTPVSYDDDWRGGAEANAHFDLQTAAGVPVRVRLSYTHALDNGVRLTGTAGTLTFDNAGATTRYVAADGMRAEISSDRPYVHGDWPVDLVSTFAEQLADFERSATQRARPRATARDAVAVAELIDWAYARHADGRGRSSIVVSPPVSRLERGRIVVTGGTGFVGGHLLDLLSEQGHSDLLVPVRSFRSGANAGRFPVRFERANLLDPASLAPLFDGARYVFHLAFGRDGDSASLVNTDGTRHVVEAAIAAGAEAVVVVSTAAVFGTHPDHVLVDETAASLGASEYERTKLQAEQWALGRARGSARTRISVINPACVYGPGGKTFTELPARLLHDGAFCWIEEGRGIVNYVYVRNLADAIACAAATPAAHGERFIVSDGTSTWRTFFTAMFGDAVDGVGSLTAAELDALWQTEQPTLRDLGRAIVRDPEVRRILRENARFERLKRGAARLFPSRFQHLQSMGQGPAGRRSQAAAATSRQRPPSYLPLLYGTTTTRISADKARRVLGWSPSADLTRGMTETRAWLAALGLLHQTTAA